MDPLILFLMGLAAGAAIGMLVGACMTMARFGFDPFAGEADEPSPHPREASQNAGKVDIELLIQNRLEPAGWIGPP